MKAAFICAVGRGDAHVGGQGQGEAAAGRRAVHQGDDRLRAAAHRDDDLADLTLARPGPADGPALLAVRPRSFRSRPAQKLRARAAQHHHADFVAPVEADEEVAQFLDQAAVESVQPLRPVHGHPEGVATVVEAKVFVVHRYARALVGIWLNGHVLVDADVGRAGPARARR